MGKTIRRKARFFADGYKNKTPEAMPYSSEVSRDSIWIALKIESLDDLDVLAFDI